MSKIMMTESQISSVFDSMPKIKDLKPYGLKYTVGNLKKLLSKKTQPDGEFRDNKWRRDFMVFPEELDMLNIIIQSKLGKFYFFERIKNRGDNVSSYDNWFSKVKKEDLDDFPIPQNVFDSMVNILNK